MTLDEKLNDLLSELEPITDPQERMSLVVDSFPKALLLPAEQRHDGLRIPGCVSAAWLKMSVDEAGLCRFQCAADSPLVQGLLGCLVKYFSGHSAADIQACPHNPLSQLGLLKNLSPTRQNGLQSAYLRIRNLAQGL